MTSVYVFASLADYFHMYSEIERKNEIKESMVLDLYIKPGKDKKRLWIVTNQSKIQEPPGLKRSFVHFRTGTCEKWKEGDEIPVKYDTIFYNYHDNKIVIEPKWLKESLFEFRVDRYVGNQKTRKTKIMDYVSPVIPINFKYRLYDFERNRMNFILMDEEEIKLASDHEKLSLSSPSPESS